MPISIQQISYIHPDKEVLFSDLNFAISKGQKLGLVGNNGCGKSTLLQIIAGQLSPSSGVIVRPDDIYYIPQHFGQYDSLTNAQALRIDRKQQALQAILTGEGAEIINEENWGLKKLAYPIQKKSTGFYQLIEFKAEPSVIEKLEVNFRRDERVIRFLTFKMDKYAAEYAAKRRNVKSTKKEEN